MNIQTCTVCSIPLKKESTKAKWNKMCQKCYYEYIDSLFCPINRIDEGIYLGNEEGSLSQAIFKEHNIQAVCVCAKYLQTPFQERFPYKKYQIQDSQEESILHLFQENNQWIEKMRSQGRNVFIHCAAGKSRSAAFTIAYLMKSKKLKYNQAFSRVKERRICVEPNEGFRLQLRQYQKELQGQ